jgi:hypothetical protein
LKIKKNDIILCKIFCKPMNCNLLWFMFLFRIFIYLLFNQNKNKYSTYYWSPPVPYLTKMTLSGSGNSLDQLQSAFKRLEVMLLVAHDNWQKVKTIYRFHKNYCTMLHLFDDLWLDKIIPKNNDRKERDIWKSREWE